MPRAMMPERLRRFGGEDQGNAAVEFVLMTPILLLVAVGAFYMLSLISLYNTLYTSTYRAARYLSVEGEYLPSWEGAAQDAARRFIVDEFERQQSDNVWLKYASASTLNVRLSSPKPQCAGGSQGDRALQIIHGLRKERAVQRDLAAQGPCGPAFRRLRRQRGTGFLGFGQVAAFIKCQDGWKVIHDRSRPGSTREQHAVTFRQPKVRVTAIAVGLEIRAALGVVQE